ncbi:MAG: serine hydroxymethyltransferase [Methylococcaceae bacterium TMED69]|nr:MAG: serine hydroxymethyltransferase [Methylococcaceae bacterium TMED69]
MMKKNFDSSIEHQDPEFYKLLSAEVARQEEHIELIASENYASSAVMEACGTLLTNKYAEGYPGKRYYGGCEHVDEIERLAIERAKRLFKVDYVNVQPHSGSQANAAVFLALLKPGETMLGMGLSDGGHLTHGSPVNFSGKIYQSITYGVDHKTGLIDYDKLNSLAVKHNPKIIIGGFSAYSRFIEWEKLKDISSRVGAFLLADIAHVAGLVAAGFYPSPVDFADVVTTTTHKTLRGPRSGIIMSNNEELYKKLNSAVFPGSQGGPLMHVVGAKAIAFQEALDEKFADYQKQVLLNAKSMASVFLDRSYDVVSGGTDNHLMLLDLSGKHVTGKLAEEALGKANITVNKNSVPNDKQSPFVTSGIRIGTPAITTRGFKEAEAVKVSNWICDILESGCSASKISDVKQKVIRLCDDFPVYSNNTPNVQVAISG